MADAIKWLPLSGKVQFDKNQIKFIPVKSVDIHGKEVKPSATTGSNKDFDNGEIRFKVKFADTTSNMQVILNSFTNSPIIHIALNTVGAYGILKLKDGKFELIAASGISGNYLPNTFYDIKVQIIGSKISLFVNDILVIVADEIIKKAQIQLGFFGESEIVVSDFKVNDEKSKAFVVMQFSQDFNDLYNEVIRPVCEGFDLECIRADECFTTGSIIEDIISKITESFVIIADITPNNPNVYYEVGYAHAINKPTILLSDKKRDSLPFDVSSFRTLFYDNTIAGKRNVEEKLKSYLESITLRKFKEKK